jgi:hypothetical protein
MDTPSAAAGIANRRFGGSRKGVAQRRRGEGAGGTRAEEEEEEEEATLERMSRNAGPAAGSRPPLSQMVELASTLRLALPLLLPLSLVLPLLLALSLQLLWLYSFVAKFGFRMFGDEKKKKKRRCAFLNTHPTPPSPFPVQ